MLEKYCYASCEPHFSIFSVCYPRKGRIWQEIV